MNYCARCGGELHKESDTKYACTNCMCEHFRNPKGAVAILLFTDTGKLILARRSEEPEKNKLDPIGGFLDNGENLETALYRELQEETGLDKADITDVVYLDSTFDEYPWQGEDEPVVSCYFTARLKAGKQPIAADDVASLETFSLEDIDRSDLAWSGFASILDKLQPQINKS